MERANKYSYLVLIFILLLFSFTTNSFAQTNNIFAEAVIFNTHVEITQESRFDEYRSSRIESNITAGLLLGYTIGVNIWKGDQLEFKPALMIGDFDLVGLNLGIQFKYNLGKRFFLTTGFSALQTIGNDSGNRSSLSRTYSFWGGNFGIRITPKVSFLLGYFYSNNEEWRRTFYWIRDWGDKKIIEKLGSMYKFGVEFNI